MKKGKNAGRDALCVGRGAAGPVMAAHVQAQSQREEAAHAGRKERQGERGRRSLFLRQSLVRRSHAFSPGFTSTLCCFDRCVRNQRKAAASSMQCSTYRLLCPFPLYLRRQEALDL